MQQESNVASGLEMHAQPPTRKEMDAGSRKYLWAARITALLALSSIFGGLNFSADSGVFNYQDGNYTVRVGFLSDCNYKGSWCCEYNPQCVCERTHCKVYNNFLTLPRLAPALLSLTSFTLALLAGGVLLYYTVNSATIPVKFHVISRNLLICVMVMLFYAVIGGAIATGLLYRNAADTGFDVTLMSGGYIYVASFALVVIASGLSIVVWIYRPDCLRIIDTTGVAEAKAEEARDGEVGRQNLDEGHALAQKYIWGMRIAAISSMIAVPINATCVAPVVPMIKVWAPNASFPLELDFLNACRENAKTDAANCNGVRSCSKGVTDCEIHGAPEIYCGILATGGVVITLVACCILTRYIGGCRKGSQDFRISRPLRVIPRFLLGAVIVMLLVSPIAGGLAVWFLYDWSLKPGVTIEVTPPVYVYWTLLILTLLPAFVSSGFVMVFFPVTAIVIEPGGGNVPPVGSQSVLQEQNCSKDGEDV